MNSIEAKKIIQDISRKYGFEYIKKNYYCESDKTIVVISLQKSNYDNGYYINYSFYVKELHGDVRYPKSNECDITGRFLNEMNKGIYYLDMINAEELAMNIEKNITVYLVPVINEGIHKYFELFPNDICRATLNLKNYLKTD
jgi:hypothetical protein